MKTTSGSNAVSRILIVLRNTTQDVHDDDETYDGWASFTAT
jgi:hypothetical protein